MAWHCWQGHLSFKTVVALTKSSVGCMEITDLQKKIDACGVACATCVAAKATHFLHKEG